MGRSRTVSLQSPLAKQKQYLVWSQCSSPLPVSTAASACPSRSQEARSAKLRCSSPFFHTHKEQPCNSRDVICSPPALALSPRRLRQVPLPPGSRATAIPT